MNKKVKYLLIFVTLTSLFFLSCQIGLGKEVDLEAPTITLTKMQSGTVELPSARFGGGIYCGKKVSFFGTATDNEGVDSVYAEIKWNNETEYKHFADATLTGESFQFDLTFEQNGTAYIKFVATDKAKNYNVNSSKVVTLLVDDQAPVGEAWYIDRNINGITYPLKDIEELKKVDFNSQENKDVAQNVEFSICSAFKDEMGIKSGSISIQIKNEKNELICTIPNSSTNDYSPIFNITHDTLVTANAALATGRHFLQIWYNAEDIVELPESNKAQDVQVAGGWFVWEPESDNPKITQSPLPAENTNEVLVNVKETVSATLFDDDGLKEVSCALLTNSEYNPTTDNQILATKIQEIFNRVPEAERSTRVKKHTPSSTERDVVLSFTAPDSPQGMYLVGYVTDVYGKTTTKVQLINVTDATAPTLHIASPANNSIPNVTMSDLKSATVTIEGQTLDTSGCNYLEFMWVPNSYSTDNIKKDAHAREKFNNLNSANYAPQGNSNLKQSSLDNGIKLWSVKLGAEENAGNGYKKQSFKFDVDLLNDFGTEKNEEKFFVVKVTRKDGKQTIQQYKLSADNIKPTIVTEQSKTQIVESQNDYILKFKAKKENGVAIDTSKYDIISDYDLSEEKFENGYFTATILASELKSYETSMEKPIYTFKAVDIFGNEVSEQYTLIVSSLPQLKSITSTAPESCKLNQEVYFNVNFSDTVFDDGNSLDATKPYLVLTNISNATKPNKQFKAVYHSGAGSATLKFCYTPEEGDYTTSDDGIQIDKDNAEGLIKTNGCTALKDGINVHIKESVTPTVLEGKVIKVDAVSPKISSLSLESSVDSDASKKYNGKIYLKAGTTLTANLTISEQVFVQGNPSLKLSVGESGEITLSYKSSTSNTVVFEGIVPNEVNGTLAFSSIQNIETITDTVNNSLIGNITLPSNNYIVDTKSPNIPSITKSDDSALTDNGNYQSAVNFKIIPTDTDIAKYEYSLNNGTSWNDATQANGTGSVTQSYAELCARVTDFAGNVSDPSEAIKLNIESSFPNFIVECTTPDGNYKAGDTINFRVTFDKPVNIKDTNATITFNNKTANIVPSIKDAVSYAEFDYTVKSTDSFNLENKTLTVNLTGIQDSFGFTQDPTKTITTINRPNVVCDGVAPTATMIPGTANGDSVNYVINVNNVYSKGNKIKITFSEPVQKGRGNIILRQTAGWAIPPVLTAEEFNTICNELDKKDREEDAITPSKNILALRNPDGTLMEDVEDKKALSSDSNNNYHGTGQYVGPYKKSMHGLDANNNPDISTKFVLDFDIDITDVYKEGELKKYSIGTTYGNNSSYTDPSNKTTTQEIRAALESAGLHQRVLDVTSASVEFDEENPTIAYVKFPAGLIDKTEELPLGRKWELVIEKGAFLDMAGNSFGENNASSKAEVKINTENGETFFNSDGVATPVIRVDRYSYGLGIMQSGSDGNLTSIKTDANAPKGYARVRIDCETSGATISYTVESSKKTNNDVGDISDYDDAGAKSYVSDTDTTDLSIQTVTPYDSSNNCIKLALGSGSYDESYKGIVTATATKDNFGTSSSGKEGVFQTVVYMVAPKTAWGQKCSELTNKQVSIRGTTYHDSEPRIAPFPLRDARNGSPYLRRTYINGDNYYWVSFEILCESDFSMHSATSGGNSYNWGKNWGKMKPGEFTRVTGFENHN